VFSIRGVSVNELSVQINNAVASVTPQMLYYTKQKIKYHLDIL
jgi:hypothetical protein